MERSNSNNEIQTKFTIDELINALNQRVHNIRIYAEIEQARSLVVKDDALEYPCSLGNTQKKVPTKDYYKYSKDAKYFQENKMSRIIKFWGPHQTHNLELSQQQKKNLNNVYNKIIHYKVTEFYIFSKLTQIRDPLFFRLREVLYPMHVFYSILLSPFLIIIHPLYECWTILKSVLLEIETNLLKALLYFNLLPGELSEDSIDILKLCEINKIEDFNVDTGAATV